MDPKRPVHVFLVEDNSADTYLVREALRRAGLTYELRVATDGQEALAMASRFGADLPFPDVALLDLNLPKVEGAEFLRRWSEQSHCAGIPMVIFTSSNAPSDRVLAEQYQAMFFRKPLDMEEFFRIGDIVRDLCFPPAAKD